MLWGTPVHLIPSSARRGCSAWRGCCSGPAIHLCIESHGKVSGWGVTPVLHVCPTVRTEGARFWKSWGWCEGGSWRGFCAAGWRWWGRGSFPSFPEWPGGASTGDLSTSRRMGRTPPGCSSWIWGDQIPSGGSPWNLLHQLTGSPTLPRTAGRGGSATTTLTAGRDSFPSPRKTPPCPCHTRRLPPSPCWPPTPTGGALRRRCCALWVLGGRYCAVPTLSWTPHGWSPVWRRGRVGMRCAATAPVAGG